MNLDQIYCFQLICPVVMPDKNIWLFRGELIGGDENCITPVDKAQLPGLICFKGNKTMSQVISLYIFVTLLERQIRGRIGEMTGKRE